MNARDGLSTHWIKKYFYNFVWNHWRWRRQLVCRFMFFLSIFSISLRMLLHNNEPRYGFDTRCQTLNCSIFLLISFQSILIPSLNYHTRAIHTGAKCFVLNRGIEMTRWDGMPGLLLPTELCMSLCISKKCIFP